jgi:hypothetical protein
MWGRLFISKARRQEKRITRPLEKWRWTQVNAVTYEQVLSEAERLSREEQLQLIVRLEERLRATEVSVSARPRWEDYAGTAIFPLCGEDAQVWVTRTRQESDEGRKIR